MNNKIKFMTLLLSLLAVIILAGCWEWIASGTLVFGETYKDEDIMTADEFHYFEVDLSDNETWADHEDNINAINSIGFEMWVTNNGAEAATGQIYFTRGDDPLYTTAAEVRSNAVKIFDGWEIAPDGVQTYLNWPMSLAYIESADTLYQTILETGEVTLYALAENLPYTLVVDTATVVVTVTVGY
jgi:hypothetical protein